MRYKAILSSSIGALIFLLPSFAFAAVIFQQLNHADDLGGYTNQAFKLPAGTSASQVAQIQVRWSTTVITEQYQFWFECRQFSDYSGAACPEFADAAIATDSLNPPFYPTFGDVVATIPITTGTAVPLSASRFYRLRVFRTAGGAASVVLRGDSTMNDCTGTGSAIGCPYLVISDVADVPNTTTRIIVTKPYNNETIATSTAAVFGGTGYVNSGDFETGMFLDIKYANYADFQSGAGASPDLFFTHLQIPITAAGDFIVSTTSPAIKKGQYTMQTSIRRGSFFNDALNFLGFGQFATFGITAATSTTFVGAALSGYDIYVASTTAAINGYIASSTISLAACSSWVSFNLGDCMALIFLPQPAPIATQLTNFKNGFLSYAPWGYVTRFVTILAGSGTTSLPVISANIRTGGTDGSPSYDNFHFDTQEMLSSTKNEMSSITDPQSGQNFRQVLEPFVKVAVGLTVLFTIVQDLFGLAIHRKRGNNVGHR